VIRVTFVGAGSGRWRVERQLAVRGAPLPLVQGIEMLEGWPQVTDATFALRGTTGHARYVEAREKMALDAASPPLARAEATCAALIPIRKSDAWWALPQDTRRAIFEERTHHIADSMRFLPRIARRLHHSRELGEPFDFLTWFEFAPEHAAAFDELLALLRSREEWQYVDREVELRLVQRV
jgi:hypothetical protein